jgi:hypothetical protein
MINYKIFSTRHKLPISICRWALCLSLIAAVLNGCQDEKAEVNYFPLHQFPGTIEHLGNSSLLAVDGSILMISNLDSMGSVLNISKGGELKWRKDYPLQPNSQINAITQTSGGDIYVCGANRIDSSDESIFLWKLNSEGELLFEKSLKCYTRCYAYKIVAMADGSVMLAGRISRAENLFAMRVNANGDSMWFREYATRSIGLLNDMTLSKNKDVVMTYLGREPNETMNLVLSGDGEVVTEMFTDPGNGWFGSALVEAENGDWVTCGNTLTQYKVTRTTSSGTFVWKKLFKGSVNCRPYGIIQNEAKNFMVTGVWNNYERGEDEPFILIVSPEGDMLWFKHFETERDATASNILSDNQGNYFITGISRGNVFMFGMNDQGRTW